MLPLKVKWWSLAQWAVRGISRSNHFVWTPTSKRVTRKILYFSPYYFWLSTYTGGGRMAGSLMETEVTEPGEPLRWEDEYKIYITVLNNRKKKKCHSGSFPTRTRGDEYYAIRNTNDYPFVRLGHHTGKVPPESLKMLHQNSESYIRFMDRREQAFPLPVRTS